MRITETNAGPTTNNSLAHSSCCGDPPHANESGEG